MPKKYKIKINTAAFLGAFSLEDDDGQRINAEPWPLAPDVEPTEERKAAAESWAEHHSGHASFIPHSVVYDQLGPGRKKQRKCSFCGLMLPCLSSFQRLSKDQTLVSALTYFIALTG